MTERKIFTLLVEMRCNSYCVFCGRREVDEALVRTRRRLGLIVPEMANSDTHGRYTLATACAALVRARAEGYTDLSLQGGEPTLFPDLVPLVAEARRLGFPFIGMVTNGRRLRDRDFTRDLLEAGLDGITASLLGPDAETHDALAAAPGAFDALVAGLRNAAEIALEMRRRVVVNANVITTAKTVDRLADEVRLLAGLGVHAASVHLVVFENMADDPGVREPLRFDIGRLRPALAEATAEGRRLGLRLHADVPLCLHPRLDSDELALRARRRGVSRHHFEGAAFTEEYRSKSFPSPPPCASCLLTDDCPRVPPEYLPEDASRSLRPITALTVAENVDAVLAALEPAAPDAVAEIVELGRSVALLGELIGKREVLAAPLARARGALADLMLAAAARRDEASMMAAFAAHLGLHPRAESRPDPRAFAVLRLDEAELARRTGAVSAEHAPGSLRLRFGESQAIAIDGEADASGEVHVRGAIPVLSAATTPAERVERALFLLAMAHPLRRVRRLRLTREVLEADFGEGLGLFWAIAREGAITLGV